MNGKGGLQLAHKRVAAVYLILPLLVALLIVPLAAERASAAPGDVLLCSCDASGAQGNAPSVFNIGISADGRYVAFTSIATNLVTPPTAGQQIFRKDLVTGEVKLVSCDAANNLGNGNSSDPSISADGRYVAFQSQATNLVTPATTGTQVFRKDLVTGEVRLVSANAAGTEGVAASIVPAINADGRYVSFISNATNLVTPATTNSQVFRKDLVTGEVRLVSANAAGQQSNGFAAYSTAISTDGRYVIFTSDGTNLIATPTAGQELFRKDLTTGAVVLVSSDAAGAESNLSNGFPSCSSDARYVSFASNANNLIPGVTHTQIYRKDLHTGAIALASANSAGVQGGADCLYSSISDDGRFVAFDSLSTNLVTPATAGRQIFRKDMATNAVDLASANAAGAQGDANSMDVAMSADGRFTAFMSLATNLVTGITGQQIYRKELAAPYYFYFAEGYTGHNFQEYLCLGNPSANPINVAVTYLFRDGSTTNATYNVPANSRLTRDVNAIVGPDRDVSIKCACDFPFIAERPMYFNYRGAWTGGHDAVGGPPPPPAGGGV
jgi:Tol biopolymer transport system component